LKNTSAKVISSHVEKFNPYEISPPSQSVTKVFKPNVQLYTDANIEGIMKKLVEFNSMENTKVIHCDKFFPLIAIRWRDRMYAS
jgi:hypothetical protein